MDTDDTGYPANIVWGPTDPDGEVFARALETFVKARIPGNPTVTVTNPNAGNAPCGIAAPMTMHIECVRIDRPAPELITFTYNGGRDLIVNAGYNTIPPTNLVGTYFPYVKRSDDGGTLLCTDTANRGWETNDINDSFELWGSAQLTGADVTPTPRGTPVQEVTADGSPPGKNPTIWQTFVVPAAGIAKIRVIHGARDAGEVHTIRLSTGDTGDAGTGDIINNVSTPLAVTNSGGPSNPWTLLSQDVTLNPGVYTLSFSTTNPVGGSRGGAFTDMQVILDAPGQIASVTNSDDCVITAVETTNTTTCEFWQPQCTAGVIDGWTNVATGEELTNAAFWAQVPAPSCCTGAAGGETGGGGTVSGGNLAISYAVCGTVGGIKTTLERVVILDASGGVLAQNFIGLDGAPVSPTTWTPGECNASNEPEIDQQDTTPVNVCFTQIDGSVDRYWTYERVRFNNRTISEMARTRHWFNPLTGADSTNSPVGTPVACEATLPVQVLRDVEQLGCVVDVNGVVTGRVFLVEISDGQAPDPDGHEMMLVATDGTITRPYLGAWSNCAPSTDFVQVTESEEMGCANGTPWSRRRTGFFDKDGQLLSVVYSYVDSANAAQLAAPAGFLLGDCLAPAVQETDLLYTAPVAVCIEEPAGVFSNWMTRSRITFHNQTLLEVGEVEYSANGADWTNGTPIGTVRIGACPLPLPVAGSADIVLLCGDLGEAAWIGGSVLPNTSLDDSTPDQLVDGPGWTTDYPMTTAGPGAQQGQLNVAEIEPGEIAIRAGSSLAGVRVIGWDNIDLEGGQTYRMRYRLNSDQTFLQWYLNGVAIGNVDVDTGGETEQKEFFFDAPSTGLYSIEYKSNTSAANVILSLDGILLQRYIAASPDNSTAVEYAGVQRAVIDQVVKTSGCADSVRDGLLKDIVDILGGPDTSPQTVTSSTEPGCAGGVPVTRTTTVIYNKVGAFESAVVGYSYSDGTFTNTMPVGFTLGDCLATERQYTNTVELVEGGVRTLPPVLPNGSELISWSVRMRSGTVIVTGSPAIDAVFADVVTMDPGEVISFDAGEAPFGQLIDGVSIDATAGSCRVNYQYRKPV
jgi:hypothetical protein